MGTGVFGRTNRTFPSVWLTLSASPSAKELPDLVGAAVDARTVIDISIQPALFGGFMRGTDALLMGAGGAEVAYAGDEDSAANLVHAHLIQTLSSVGREWLDLYFLIIREALTEPQITGALKALEWARDEGHVKFVGLSAEGSVSNVLAAWQNHDGFEVLLLPNLSPEESALRDLARERRVGVVTRNPARRDDRECSLVTVRSALEVNSAVADPALV